VSLVRVRKFVGLLGAPKAGGNVFPRALFASSENVFTTTGSEHLRFSYT
jgi:hypothetical protein